MNYSDTAVIIPAKDEPQLSRVVDDVLDALPNCQAIVIYKGELMGSIRKRKNLQVIRQKSSGKGAGTIEAVKRTKREIIAYLDSDGTYDAKDLRGVIELVRQGADLAVGNRLNNLSTEVMPSYIQMGNRMLTVAMNVMYGTRLHDSLSGLRAIKREVFNEIDIQEKGFEIENEMDIKVQRKGLKIAEIPIHYYEREGATGQGNKLEAGVRGLKILFKWISYKG